MAKAELMKHRFEVGSQNTLFLSASEQKNVPMDGLAMYIRQSWDTIRHNRDLNLPDQREMVANFRCNELKEEALKAAKEPSLELQKKCEHGLVENFSQQCNEIIDQAVNYYNEVAHQYDKNVFKKIQGELLESLLGHLYMCFDAQMKQLRNQSY